MVMKTKGARADLFLPTELVGTLPPAIRNAIRAARHRRRVSQARLAHLCGLSVRHIVAIEGGANFTVSVLILLLRELPQLQIVDAIQDALAQMAGADAQPRS
jgi:DNA-binding XRE family transcriptional regulator